MLIVRGAGIRQMEFLSITATNNDAQQAIEEGRGYPNSLGESARPCVSCSLVLPATVAALARSRSNFASAPGGFASWVSKSASSQPAKPQQASKIRRTTVTPTNHELACTLLSTCNAMQPILGCQEVRLDWQTMKEMSWWFCGRRAPKTPTCLLEEDAAGLQVSCIPLCLSHRLLVEAQLPPLRGLGRFHLHFVPARRYGA